MPPTISESLERARLAALPWLRRLLFANLPFALILAAALILPDFVMDAASGARRAVYTPDIVLYFLLFGVCVSFVAAPRLIAGLLIVLGAFEILHFCYMAYFGGVIDANLILHGLVEMEDVALGAAGVLSYVYYAPLVVILPYAAAWLLLRPLLPSRAVIPRWSLALLLAATAVPVQIVRDGSAIRYYPVDTLPSAANAYLTFSTLFFDRLPGLVIADAAKHAADPHPPRIVRNTPPAKATIVIVMNESLTSDHMSLFGYGRDTTPRLAALRGDPAFVYRRGISAGVGTRSTFHSFWNEVHDPRDEEAFVEQRSNLFRLARESGFRTIFLSAQRANLMRGNGLQYVDVLHTLESEESRYERLHDEMFLELLREIPLEDRNLIVVQFRSAHSPYADNYTPRIELATFPTQGLDYRRFQQNSYDNAVRYNDLVMSELIDYFRKTVAGPLYVFLTSDHGQLLGEGKHQRIGHGMLLPEVAHVPIMLYSQNGDPAIAAALRQMKDPTHYELTGLIDRAMGIEVRDPDADSGVFYINGYAYNARAGYITVKKSERHTRFTRHPAG